MSELKGDLDLMSDLMTDLKNGLMSDSKSD